MDRRLFEAREASPQGRGRNRKRDCGTETTKRDGGRFCPERSGRRETRTARECGGDSQRNCRDGSGKAKEAKEEEDQEGHS